MEDIHAQKFVKMLSKFFAYCALMFTIMCSLKILLYEYSIRGLSMHMLKGRCVGIEAMQSCMTSQPVKLLLKNILLQ